jgi:hypothetical protein
MRETARDVQLLTFVGAERRANPSPVIQRIRPDIHDDIVDSPLQHADKLCLLEGRALEMQAAQCAPGCRKRLVILYEVGIDANLLVRGFRPDLHEMPTPVDKPLGADQ